MKRLLLLAVGATAGYVLGARAGRERYDQIMQTASKAWQSAGLDQRTREVADQATLTARQAGEWAAGSATDAMGSARHSMAGSRSGAHAGTGWTNDPSTTPTTLT
jgi:hypothetical protein